MRVAQINSVCGKGSTGKICAGICFVSLSSGIENKVFYSNGFSSLPYSHKFSTNGNIRFQSLKAKLFGNYGFNSLKATKKLIQQLDIYKPDIVHIHNLHGHDVNFEMLLAYLKEKKIRVVYTFHDCWAFTGYCTYFTMAKCDRWKSKCYHCPLRGEFSWFFDRSTKNQDKKKKAFFGLDLTIVTPSNWLAAIVKNSFLKDNEIKTINNGIDLNVFRPTQSSFRKEKGLEGKKVLLGVADRWDRRKGFDVFLSLSRDLPDDFRIVLVGIDQKVRKTLPNNIIAIQKTQNQTELAGLYSSADLFVNPTREDNYPTVNLESLACGTPVLTYRTGGSPEIIDDTCGSVVATDDLEALENEIIRICRDSPYSHESCLNRAKQFDMNERYRDYISLYKSLLGR